MSLTTTHSTEPVRPFKVQSPTVHCFAVSGAADPGFLPRVMELWAKRGLVPDRWHSARTAGEGHDLQIDIETSELDHALAMQIAESMRGMFGVSQVLVSEKRFAATA